MTKTYKLFRVYCFVCIMILCLLLVSVGLITVKQQTEETVFNATYSTVKIYSSKENIVMKFGEELIKIKPEKIVYTAEKASPVIFAPINNVIELIKAVKK